MTQVTVNGHVYSDDGSAARDMLNGGAKTWHFPMIVDVMHDVNGVSAAAAAADADAAAAAASASAAAASAITAASAAAGLAGSSTTSVTVGAGAKGWATEPGKQFQVGQFIRVQRIGDPAVYMYGRSTAYNSITGTLNVNVERFVGSGTFGDWSIFVTSEAGAVGPSGSAATGTRAVNAADTVIATDNFKVLRLNGGFTLGGTAAATLGTTFSTILQNIGVGIVSFDPAGSETVNGASTLSVQPGTTWWVFTVTGGWVAVLLDAGLGGVLHVRYQTVGAGPTVAVGYTNIDINTTVTNTIAGANISGGAITLPAGTYDMEGDAMFAAKSRVILGLTSGVGPTTVPGLSSLSMPSLRGRFSIGSPASYYFRLYNASGSSAAFGSPIGDGDPEIYADVIFKKVA